MRSRLLDGLKLLERLGHMRTRAGRFVGLLLVGVICAVGAIGLQAAKLPDEALKRAQQAEKKLEANKPQEAVTILLKVDKDYPNHAAVSLRIAQIYDTMNNTGAALYFYRRYAKLAEDRPMEEASARLYTLELMPDAVKVAEELSKKGGEKLPAMSVPTPAEQRTLVKVNPDGSKTRLNSMEDFQKTTPDEPATSPQAAKTFVIPDNKKTRGSVAQAQPVRATPMASKTPTTAIFTPPASVPTARMANTPAPQEDTPLPAATPDNTRNLTPVPVSRASSGIKLDVSDPLPAAPIPMETPVRESTPLPKAKPRQAGPGADFFKENSYKGSGVTIKLSNEMTDALVTFTASPPVGDPINVVLVQGEKRTLTLTPGEYSIVATVSTTNYPPATLQDKRFDIEFAAGKVYSRSFTAESLQMGNR